ncbi:MAG: periplasmic heavy metal sensor [Magnetospirillum sp.]|nr:periplasmic heavy metal sensor [Magnetospirillum sp.]
MSPLGVHRWLLPASLALNAFLGALLIVPGDDPPPRRDLAHMAEEMAAALPPADAAILRGAVARQAGAMARARAGMRAFPEGVRAALEAPVFQPDALRQALASGREARDAFDDAMAAALVEAVGAMSPEGRRRLAAWRPHHPPPRD